MFDTSQLVHIEIITLLFASLFLLLGLRFDNIVLGLIAGLECILTTFMNRHETMSYWIYEGIQSELSFIFYNTSIIIVQTAVIAIVSFIYRSPFFILAYSANILINTISFMCGQAVILSPDSIALLDAQSLIDDKIYWYVYSISMLFICIGIMRNGHRKGGGTRSISLNSYNLHGLFHKSGKLARIMARIKRRVQNT